MTMDKNRLRNRLLGAAALSFIACAAQAQTVVVRAAHLLDPVTGRMLADPVVVITDGKVVHVGSGTQPLPTPPEVEQLDLPGVTLLPGLIDMHVHLTSSPVYGGYSYLQFSDAFWTAVGVRNAKDTLEAGFTTVRNLGSEFYGDVGLREAVSEGHIPGPRIVSAAYSFGATGGHCDSTFFPPSMDEKSPYVSDGPEAARRNVRTLRKYGAQVIKICATGGVFSRGSEPGAQQMAIDEIKAVTEAAQMAGMKVAAHAHGAPGIRAAILGGVDTIEHASLVDDEGIRLAREHGVWFSMDIYNTEYTQSEGRKNGVLEDNLRKDRDIAEIQRENFRKALRAGVKMVYGTDAGVFPHGQNGRQFAVMVRYGATPLQAIQSATVNAAEALGQAGQVGVVAPGAWGDMVGVVGDPLADVTLLEAPVFVMKGGETVKRP